MQARAARRVRRAGREAIYYGADLVHGDDPDQVRLLIFGQGRTGSALLEDLLASTGWVSSRGEVLNARRGEVRSPARFVRGMARAAGDESVVCHVKINHLVDDRRRPVDPGRFVRSLVAAGWRVVYLHRRNTVRHVMSNVVAEHRGAPHHFGETDLVHRVRVDMDAFVARVNHRFELTRAERLALQGVDVHEIVYEDHLERAASHQATIDGVADWLALARRPVHTRHRKVVTADLRDVVVAYDEFVDGLTAAGLDAYVR